MTVQIQTAKFVANIGSGEKVFAADIDVSDNPKYAKFGRLILLLTIKNQQNPTEIVTNLAKNFYETEVSVENKLANLINIGSNLDSLVAASIINDRIIIASFNSFCFLYRDQKLAQIITPHEKFISGVLTNSDNFLLATPEFVETISISNLPLTTSYKEIDDFVKDSGSIEATAGAILIRVISSPSHQVDSNSPQIIINEPLVKTSKFNFGLKSKIVAGLDFVITRLPDNSIKIEGDTVSLEKIRNKHVAATVGVILIFLLIVSVIFGIKAQRQRELKLTYETRLSEAKHKFEEAVQLESVDPARARELLLSADSLVKSILDEGIKDEKVLSLSQSINNNLGEVAGIYISEPELFIDLSLQIESFSGTDLSFSDGNIAVLDTTNKQLIQVGVDNKRTEIIAGPQTLPETLAVTNYVDKNYVLSKNGFWQAVNEEVELVLEKAWEGNILVHVFGNNVYILEINSSQIYRFPGISGNKFGARQIWLSEGINVDLSQVIDWSVDGSIWVLRPEGKIQKFTRGTVDSFKLGNIDQGITSATDIYTDEDSDFLYVLDKSNQRVVVITKDGEYIAEYKNQKIADTRKIIVSEEDKKLILLTGDKLYSVELKHLQ